MKAIGESAVLWFEAGIPARMVFRGVRWRVIDAPTAEGEGWRFTARAEDGTALAFDLEPSADGHWTVARQYA